MTTAEVATKLVELCRQGKIDEVQETLYAQDAQSIEANEMMGPKVVTGLEAIKAKSIAFQAGVEEFHSATISDPIVAGNSFAITWAMDATFKGRGRMTIEEVCTYQVKDGKITLEQFFY
ncbi:SnoaL-like domain-containing protein [Parasediminibacterium sp. JCM 36343]|uniref:SnoaL-like domain-containing protein n=1 Tax=Parasediminibacterium sp. JCM 36343 TaxID=3374279 RepID=UPI00397CD61D